MIQRIQSIYLFIAALLAAFLGIYNPHLWRAKLENSTYFYFSGQSNYGYFALTLVIILLSLVCIFLFKNRKLQYRLTVLNLLLSIGWIVLQYFLIDGKETTFIQKDMLASATYLPAAFIPIPVIILLFLAARGIRKDEKLIKSLDRLR